jgi:tetratricopeptide (TPR) repeat protein
MLGRGHQNFGILNSIKGNHSKAIENFLLSEKYYQELKDTLALALLVGNLGVTFEEAGNYDKALQYMHKQLALARTSNNKNLQGWSMTNIGSVHSMRGDADSALYYYDHSLEIARGGDDYDLIITNLDNIGTYYSTMGEYDKATSI